MRPRRRSHYEPIGTAHIATLLAEALRDPARVREALGVWPAWEEAVGPQIAAAAQPVSLRDGVLTVHVRTSVWMQELSAQRESLLKRVQRVPAGALVRELRLKVAPRRENAAKPPPAKVEVKTAPIPYDLARAIRAVQAPELRGAMIRVAAKWAGLQRVRGR